MTQKWPALLDCCSVLENLRKISFYDLYCFLFPSLITGKDFFVSIKGPSMLIWLSICPEDVLSLLKKAYIFLHEKFCLPESESSGRARRPRGWASGQWAPRF